jgi:general secretion pathway protein G
MATREGQHRRLLVRRAIWSALVALLVLLISIWVAFLQYRGSPIRYAQEFTLRDIGRVQAAMEAYREETGALPQTLREVAAWSQEDDSWNLRVDDSGAPVDAWKRLLQYSTDGATYRITSYGYDGKPGGTGLHYDLSSEDLGTEDSSEGGKRLPRAPEAAQATFGQFVTDTGLIKSLKDYMHGSGLMMVLTCVLASVATFVVAFLSLGHRGPARRTVGARLLNLVLIVGATLWISAFITAFHAPSGH